VPCVKPQNVSCNASTPKSDENDIKSKGPTNFYKERNTGLFLSVGVLTDRVYLVLALVGVIAKKRM
jgi:hypothetical protein